jgi:hypothetical protein
VIYAIACDDAGHSSSVATLSFVIEPATLVETGEPGVISLVIGMSGLIGVLGGTVSEKKILAHRVRHK